MTAPDEISGVPSQTLRDWLVGRVAIALEVSPDSLDTSQPIGTLGLDSLQALSLAGEAEDLLGLQLSPEFMSPTFTIDQIADRLCQWRQAGGPQSV